MESFIHFFLQEEKVPGSLAPSSFFIVKSTKAGHAWRYQPRKLFPVFWSAKHSELCAVYLRGMFSASVFALRAD